MHLEDKKIWIIVPVFDRDKEIFNLLKNFFSQTVTYFHVVVVDHGTKKINFSSISDTRLTVLTHSSELWWTGAVNRGLKYVIKQKQKQDVTLIINDDVSVDSDYLQQILSAAKNHPDTIVGSLSIDRSKGVILKADSILSLFRARYVSSWQGKKLKDINKEFTPSDVLPGRGMIIPDIAISKVGFFNEKELPHYGADNEYVWRSKENGINAICHKKCVVYTLPKEKSLYEYKKNFYSFFCDKKKPGNLRVTIKMALLCFNKTYAHYYIAVNFFRFLMAYIKQFVKNLWFRFI